MNKMKRMTRFGKAMLTTALIASLCCGAAFAAEGEAAEPTDPDIAVEAVVENDATTPEDVIVTDENDAEDGEKSDETTAPVEDKADAEDAEAAGDAETADDADTEGEADGETEDANNSARTRYIIVGGVIIAFGVVFYAVLHIKSKSEKKK